MSEPGTDLVLAHSGQLVNLEDSTQVGKAFCEVREITSKLKEADRLLRDALSMHARLKGTKTLYIDGVGKFEIRGSEATEFPDPLALAEALRAAGCPEDVVDEIVVARIEYKVDQRRATRAALANPEYAEVIEQHKVKVERTPTISIS